MQELQGKTAVVTGAGSGMGRAFAERFADAGMNVVLADIEEPRLDDALASVRGRGVEAIGVATDVSDPPPSTRCATPRWNASAGSTSCATTPASPTPPSAA